METEIPVPLPHAKIKKLMEGKLEGQHSKESRRKASGFPSKNNLKLNHSFTLGRRGSSYLWFSTHEFCPLEHNEEDVV